MIDREKTNKDREKLLKIFQSKERLLHGICGARVNQLSDYTHTLILQEIGPYLKDDLSGDKRMDLIDELLGIIVDLADKALEVGVDTASMVLTGVDPYSTYTQGVHKDRL